MDLGGITNNIGAIVGGIVVLVVAYFLFKPRPKNDPVENATKDIVSKEGSKGGSGKTGASPEKSTSDNQISPVWKTRRYLLKKVRSLKKPDISLEKRHETSTRPINSNEEPISYPVDVAIPDLPGGSLDVQEETLDNHFAVEESEKDTLEIPLQPITDDNNINNGETEITINSESTDTGNSPENDLSSVAPVDETAVENTQLEVTLTNVEPLSEKPKRTGDVFDLFTEEDDEENESSKFASKLDQVDVKNLLTEAENIQKYIRR